MANMTFGVNILRKSNANVKIGDSTNPWTIVAPDVEDSISMGREANSTVGDNSTAIGNGVTAAGDYSHAEGSNTIATHRSHHVFGEYNEQDSSVETSDERGDYVEIVGNGSGDQLRSNARTLDWSGNERLNGSLYVNCNDDSTGGSEVLSEAGVTWAQLKG